VSENIKPGGTALIFAGSRTQHRMAVNVEDAGFILKDTLMWFYGSGFPKATDISKQFDKKFGAATPEAKLWNGWKSHGLKPAYEPILVVMKPNEGSYAQNALKWGVAGLNIDGARIGTNENLGRNNKARTSGTSYVVQKETVRIDNSTGKGRYPANIILECICEEGKHTNPECPCYMLDEQSGESKSVASIRRNRSGMGIHDSEKGTFGKGDVFGGFNDKGGASRFFYCAKASKKERGEGNSHPTVKPIKLMEYLVKLTSMPNPDQIYLDPFLGSGTTGVACKNLNRKFIGIELDEQYFQIAKDRISKEA